MVRLEIEFEVLVTELRHLEDDLNRMSIQQFIEVWNPEMTHTRAMLRLINMEEKPSGRGKRNKNQGELFPSDNREILN